LVLGYFGLGAADAFINSLKNDSRFLLSTEIHHLNGNDSYSK